jgi:dihydrofolate synthase/folylpolyglutamate synthase
VPIPGAHEPAHDAAKLASIVREAGIDAVPAVGVAEALALVEAEQPGPKRVLIGGSLYLAGHVLALQQGLTAQSN